MKKTIAAVFLIALGSSAFAQTHVNGYYKQNGTYVQPHMRSSPNSTTLDNYSTKGNVNPYTGQAGTKNPDPQDYYAQPVQQQRQVQPVQQIQPLQMPQPLQPIQPLQPMQSNPNRF
jgi:hypothetical protein